MSKYVKSAQTISILHISPQYLLTHSFSWHKLLKCGSFLSVFFFIFLFFILVEIKTKTNLVFQKISSYNTLFQDVLKTHRSGRSSCRSTPCHHRGTAGQSRHQTWAAPLRRRRHGRRGRRRARLRSCCTRSIAGWILQTDNVEWIFSWL